MIANATMIHRKITPTFGPSFFSSPSSSSSGAGSYFFVGSGVGFGVGEGAWVGVGDGVVAFVVFVVLVKENVRISFLSLLGGRKGGNGCDDDNLRIEDAWANFAKVKTNPSRCGPSVSPFCRARCRKQTLPSR